MISLQCLKCWQLWCISLVHPHSSSPCLSEFISCLLCLGISHDLSDTLCWWHYPLKKQKQSEKIVLRRPGTISTYLWTLVSKYFPIYCFPFITVNELCSMAKVNPSTHAGDHISCHHSLFSSWLSFFFFFFLSLEHLATPTQKLHLCGVPKCSDFSALKAPVYLIFHSSRSETLTWELSTLFFLIPKNMACKRLSTIM